VNWTPNKEWAMHKPWRLHLNGSGNTELRVGRANRRVWFVVELLATQPDRKIVAMRVTDANRKPWLAATRDGLRLGRLLVTWDRPVHVDGSGATIGDAGCTCGRVGCDGSRAACIDRWK